MTEIKERNEEQKCKKTIGERKKKILKNEE